MQGEVAVNRRVDTKSYTSLHALVHGMFPPISSSSEQVSTPLVFASSSSVLTPFQCKLLLVLTSSSWSIQEDYNAWNYWKMPLPDVDL